MTIYTIKLSKKRLAAMILVVAVVVAAVILAWPSGAEAKAGESPGVSTGAPPEVRSAADGAAYIEGLGYAVRPEAADTRKVTIPQTFDDVYTRYNAIQQETGFDLAPYMGKGVTLYTFYVTNYTGYDDVLIDLLVYRDAVIGGAVYTASIDGFMHGLIPNPGA
jgi:hypothetical protein